MADPLADFMTHAQQVPTYIDINLSEADTRVYLIDPVLRALGYANVGDIRREVPVPATKEFLDYELYADGKAQAIVEAKALRHAVTDQASGQCVQYAAILGVRWCIITNGINWVVYNAHATGPLSEKRVASVRMDGDEESLLDAWDVLSLFSKQSLAQANPLSRLLAERVIMDELSRAESPAVTALRKAVRDRFGERVTAQTVLDVIEKVTAKSGARPGHIAHDTSELPPPDASVNADSPIQKPRQEVLKPDGTRVSTEDLIAHGLVPADSVIDARSRAGVSYVARLRGSGVDLAGENYPNLSSAAAAALKVPSANGWTFWMYQGVSFADLRRRLVSELATAALSGAV